MLLIFESNIVWQTYNVTNNYGKGSEDIIISAEPQIIQLIRSPFFFLKRVLINLVYMKKNSQVFEKLRGEKMEATLPFPADA